MPLLLWNLGRVGFSVLLVTSTGISHAQDGEEAADSPPPAVSGMATQTPSASKATGDRSASAAVAAAKNLSPLVEDVQVVGPWSSDGRQGVWRTVMVQSPADQTEFHFFVQQLDGSGTDLSLIASTEIAEVNQMDGAIVGYRVDEPSPEHLDSLTLFFDILPADGEVSETYELHFFADGPYNFGPATN